MSGREASGRSELERAIRGALLDGARVRADLDVAAIADAAELVRGAILAGRKILLCGNGGSAADAQHIAAELVGRYVLDRRPLAAISLTTDTSALTSIANDYGYEHVFARQVEALGAPGDVLIAITTSGTSKNVVAAVAAARARGMKVVGLTGRSGAAFAASCDACVAVASGVTARIQECHIAIGHLLCEAVDEAVASAGAAEAVRSNGHAATAVAAPAKQRTLEQLIAWREDQRARKRTVVWTNGVFDVLHAGHLASLRGARQFGDVLIVGVNGDASVRTAKGPTRPVFPCEERVALLAALELVDAILVFDDPTPERVLAQLRPDVHAKGADYAPPGGKPIPERAIVEAYGGRVEFIPLVPGRSSTETLARLDPSGARLDRDGTLITDVGYPRDPERVELLPGAIEALVELQRRFALVIVSNQSGIGRGLITEAEARSVHDRVIELLARGGVQLAGAYYCPHVPEAGCPCRKPAPGLIVDAARELGLDLARSVLLGDKPSDMAAGIAAGCGVVIRFGPDADGAGSTARCDDWPAVARRFVAIPSEPR